MNVLMKNLNKKTTIDRLGFVFAFTVIGLILGLISVWHDERTYDNPFLLNLPGALLGETISGIWHRYFGIGTPWFIAEPQVVIWASVLFWGFAGFLLVRFFRIKIIAWIIGAYLVVFGGFTIAYNIIPNLN